MNDKLKINTLISLACDFVINKTHTTISGIITKPIITEIFTMEDVIRDAEKTWYSDLHYTRISSQQTHKTISRMITEPI